MRCFKALRFLGLGTFKVVYALGLLWLFGSRASRGFRSSGLSVFRISTVYVGFLGFGVFRAFGV